MAAGMSEKPLRRPVDPNVTQRMDLTTSNHYVKFHPRHTGKWWKSAKPEYHG